MIDSGNSGAGIPCFAAQFKSSIIEVRLVMYPTIKYLLQ